MHDMIHCRLASTFLFNKKLHVPLRHYLKIRSLSSFQRVNNLYSERVRIADIYRGFSFKTAPHGIRFHVSRFKLSFKKFQGPKQLESGKKCYFSRFNTIRVRSVIFVKISKFIWNRFKSKKKISYNSTITCFRTTSFFLLFLRYRNISSSTHFEV